MIDVMAITPREREVLACLERRLKRRQIADFLVITEATVDCHLASIYSKYHVHTSEEALRRARECGDI